MAVPGEAALLNPTNFPRSDRIPFDVDQSNGVETDFGGSDPFDVNGQTTLYDRAKDSNTGFPAVNRPLTYTFVANTTEIGCSDPYYHEAFCFVSGPRRHTSIVTGTLAPKVKILSISAFNRYLRQPAQRERFGKQQHVADLKVEWRFMGSVKRPHRPIIPDDAVPIIFGGRARTLDLGRSYLPGARSERLRKGVPGQLDHMFLLYRRYRLDRYLNDDTGSNHGSIVDHAGDQLLENTNLNPAPQLGMSELCPYFWQVEVFMNRSGKPPDLHAYTNEDCVDARDNYFGDYERVGFVGFVYGDRNFSTESVERARKLTRGKDGYAEEAAFLENVELFIGVS